jgi:hypothetical protein
VDDWGAQVYLWSYVYQVGFDDDGDSEVTHIFETIDLSRQKCGIDSYNDRPTFIQESHITDLSLAKANGGPPTLYVTATLGKKTPTEKERKACEEGVPIPLALKPYRLVFLLNGSAIIPTLKTEETLKIFPKPESPEDSHSPNH